MRCFKRYGAGIILALAMTLPACGFHVRGDPGASPANLSSLNLIDTTAGELGREVRSQLQAAGVAVTNTSDYTLTIYNERFNRSVLSISPATGKAEEFQLTLTARLSLARTDGTELISNELVTAAQDYLFDEDALLAKASEENVLKDSLRRRSAATIIRRVSATTGAIRAAAAPNH